MLPNLLASKKGRLTAFFFLYVTEGLPYGFTSQVLVVQMRRQGLSTSEVGAFFATLSIPWMFKWLIAPFVDMFSSKRFGHRRLWILLMQIAMTACLLASMPVKFSQEIALFSFLPDKFHLVFNLFTAIIFAHNIFGATNDVAIDALACNALNEKERGLANGLMFGGAYIGQMVGGPVSLKIIDYVNNLSGTPEDSTLGLRIACIFVSCCILAITIFIAIPMKEPMAVIDIIWRGSRLKTATHEVKVFSKTAFKAFTGTRAAFIGVLFALLPPGAYALSLVLMSNVAVEIGLDDNQIGNLGLASTIFAAGGCVLGGLISDKIGRRKSLAYYIILTTIPTIYFGYMMHHFDWINPVVIFNLDKPVGPITLAQSLMSETGIINPVHTIFYDRPVGPAGLIMAFWIASIVYSLFNGLVYGARNALFMDVCCPKVAGTQFTAYMSLLNLTIAYSAWWQTKFAESWGYPKTFLIDAAFGLLCLALLPLMKPAKKQVPELNS